MKEGFTEIVFILDKSGSMCGLEFDTIGGYNSFIEKQKQVEGEACVSTVLFSDESKVVHDRVPISRIEPMTSAQYTVDGCTALLDAIGAAIHHIGKVHKKLSKEELPEKTIFVITTDGAENSSLEYDYKKIKKMIEKKQKKNKWEFLFLGANIDAIGEAGKLGIRKNRAVRYECDKKGTILNFECVSDTIGCLRMGKDIKEDWCDEIVEYQQKKGE